MKLKIGTIEDQVKANRKTSRDEEIRLHGKPVTFRHTLHRSKKQYSRKGKNRNNVPETE